MLFLLHTGNVFSFFLNKMSSSTLHTTIVGLSVAIGTIGVLYFGALASLIAVPSLQTYVTYLHKVTLTWSKDLNVPEQFGFAQHQATPFYISTSDGEKLHAWHVLPLATYIENQAALSAQGREGGLVDDFESTVNFQLLRTNKDARLVLYFHGAGGTMASGCRPESYRSLYAADPVNTHILTFDYRGYGKSSGYPSELGVINDALAITDWALNTAGIAPEHIAIYGQSLGSAVAIALVDEYARKHPEIRFAGLVVTATFSNIGQLTATYRIGGFIPVLSPVATIPALFEYFTSRLSSKWDNIQRLSQFILAAGAFDITFLHAEDDIDVPLEHSTRFFRAAVAVAETTNKNSSYSENVEEKMSQRTQLRGAGGSITIWPTTKGPIRLEILKYGVHDKIMLYPATSIAINRILGAKHTKIG